MNVLISHIYIFQKDSALIWRGPKKNGLIKQLLRDVDWDNLDYLLVDTPPGTSDEHLSIVQYLSGAGWFWLRYNYNFRKKTIITSVHRGGKCKAM